MVYAYNPRRLRQEDNYESEASLGYQCFVGQPEIRSEFLIESKYRRPGCSSAGRYTSRKHTLLGSSPSTV